jgi:fatty-acyl-CoA synthase
MTRATAASRQSIIASLGRNVAKHPSKPFLELELPNEKGAISYLEMWNQARRCGAQLVASGVKPGGIVLIFLPQGSSGLAYFIGAMMAGFVPSFMPLPSSKQDPARYWSAHSKLFDRISPAALIANELHLGEMEANGLASDVTKFIAASAAGDFAPLDPVAAESEDTAFLQHSSGTTGLKKGVMLSHRAVLRQIEAYREPLGATADDVVVSWLPVYHDMGLIACFVMPMVLGQTIVLLDPFHWVIRPGALFQAIHKHRGTLCWLPNFAFDHLANLVRPNAPSMDLRTMRAFINCSEPCQSTSMSKFLQRFASLGVKPSMVGTCYAMAETVFAISQTKLEREGEHFMVVDREALQERGEIISPQLGRPTTTLVSNGTPLPGMSVSVHDPDGEVLPEGRVGELYVAADFLFSGYYRLPDLTTERLRGGIYRTSDRGVLVGGEVYALGRMDDLLILNGRNFHAAEIESLVGMADGVKPGRNAAFAVFKVDSGSNELIVVCEREDPSKDDTIRENVRKIIFDALGLHPSDVHLVPPGWISKTSSGKLSRHANAEKYALEIGGRT